MYQGVHPHGLPTLNSKPWVVGRSLAAGSSGKRADFSTTQSGSTEETYSNPVLHIFLPDFDPILLDTLDSYLIGVVCLQLLYTITNGLQCSIHPAPMCYERVQL